jgi:NADP-reducing hydrogenase subunit HndB
MGTSKINSWDELKKYRANVNGGSDGTVIAVGMATCGIAAGAGAVMDALKDEMDKRGVNDVSLVSTGCYGFCYAEPLVEVRVPGAPVIRYGYVDEQTARRIVSEHIVKGELLDNIIIGQEVQKP